MKFQVTGNVPNDNAGKSLPARGPQKSKNGRVLKLPKIPFIIAIDDRERSAGWTFHGMRSDSKHKYRDYEIQSQVVHLKTGDYSIIGHEKEFTIERKSLSDLYGTIGGFNSKDPEKSSRRERFEAEFNRMAYYRGHAHVIVEGPFENEHDFLIVRRPMEGSGVHPNSVVGTILSWMQRFPMVHWWMMPSRRDAEIMAFRLMMSYYENISSREEHEEKNFEGFDSLFQ